MTEPSHMKQGDDKINLHALAVTTKNWAPDTEQFYRSLAPKLEYRTWTGLATS